MLVLSRKLGEKVVIDGDITVTITAIQGDRVRIGIEAPAWVRVLRAELVSQVPNDAEVVCCAKSAGPSDSDQSQLPPPPPSASHGLARLRLPRLPR